MKIYVQQSIDGFDAVRKMLAELRLTPKTPTQKLAFHLLYPLDTLSEGKNDLSLTDAVDEHSQIRYSQLDRVMRLFYTLSHMILQCERLPAQITFCHSNEQSDGARIFFDVFHQFVQGRCKIIHTYQNSVQDILRKFSELEQIYFKNTHTLSDTEKDQLISAAKKYVLSGNYWGADAILKKISAACNTAELNLFMGICSQFFGHTFEAECWYKRAYDAGCDHEKVSACYVLAMLYARHHPVAFQSQTKSEDYLNDAYSIIEKTSDQKLQENVFSKVFNRNGYALLLFRKGEISKAADILTWGMSELADYHKTEIHLHRTVLLYNRAQCYHAQRRYADAMRDYQTLLSHDPHFPEYHMELARCYLDQELYRDAFNSLQRAEKLGHFIPELFSQLGFCSLMMGDSLGAESFYYRAYQLCPNKAEYIYDYAYILSESKNYSAAKEVLQKLSLYLIPDSMKENFFSLFAEIYINGDVDMQNKVGDIFSLAKLCCPDSKLLEENILLFNETAHEITHSSSSAIA